MTDDGVVCIGGGPTVHALLGGSGPMGANMHKKGLGKITAIMANDFLEWTLSSPYYLCVPEDYMNFVSPNKKAFEYPGVDYVYDVVLSVDTGEKTVTCKSGKVLRYKVLIVASGYDLPIISRAPGQTLLQRKLEVEAYGAAIKKANTVVINGAGAIGFEMAAEVKLRYPSVRTVMLTRSGKIFNSEYDEGTLSTILKEVRRIGIEVMKGSVDGDIAASNEPGKLALSGGDISTLEFDVYLPCFVRKLNTDFMPEKTLVSEGRLRPIKVNEFLQCAVAPEVFVLGPSTCGQGFSLPKISKQAKDTVVNTQLLLEGKPLIKHAEEAPGVNYGLRPATIKLGYAPGGWFMWDNLPGPEKACFKLLGAPCCIPICCWPCCGGTNAACACGPCCGAPMGQGPQRFYVSFFGIGGVTVFSKLVGLNGMGEAASPEVQQMIR